MHKFIEKGFISGFQAKNIINNSIFNEIINFDINNHYNPTSFTIALLCEESSSRTRFSTESIIAKIGGNVIYINSLSETSIAKGESLEESAALWSNYFDLIAIRSKSDFLPYLFNKYSTIPVVNLGDGSNEHPTQALSTLTHAFKQFGHIKNLNICIWGDVLKSRTAHSVAIMFSLLGANIYLAPIPKSQIPEKLILNIKRIYSKANIKIIEDLSTNKASIDIFYINRLQKERWDSLPNYNTFQEEYCEQLGPNGILLHPLPHNEEIDDRILKHPQSRIQEHIKITYKTRAWVFHKYKLSFDMKIKLKNNTNFLDKHLIDNENKLS
jgi:aspartate carbamoyltransferase catalytic subunit